MKDKYHIDALNKSTRGAIHYDACTKPHADAQRIANSLGFKTVYLHGSRLSKLGKPIWKKILFHTYNLSWQAYVLWQARSLDYIKGADIFIQYGFTTEAMFSVVRRLKKNGNTIILLIHDLDSLRFSEETQGVDKKQLNKLRRTESELLNNIDIAIVHTQPMAERLKEIGFKGRIEILGFFDYLNDYEPKASANIGNNNVDIVFAGNLDKSRFTRNLHNLPQHPGYRFLLYGKYSGELITSDSVLYKGYFHNDDLAGFEGTWGLVWDGDDTNTCSGIFGEYLAINAPFKFSLYLAKGLPLIVWKQSAMAHYVEKNHLGITVNSLEDIYCTIRALTNNQIEEIFNNVLLYSDYVRKGEMLTHALNMCLNQ